jgi:cytoskeletal protein RodZ
VATQRPTDPASRLRLARESRGLSYRQIADATKLSARVVEALETNRISTLPAGIYRRAIVRAVAVEVGLDPEQLLDEYVAAFPNELPQPPPSHIVPAVTPAMRMWPRSLAMLAAFIPILGALGYFIWPERAAVPAPLQPLPSRPLVARSSEVVPAGGFGDSEPRPLTVTLTISTRCHLRVLSDGRELIERTVSGGERVKIELGDEIILSGDNAAAVQFSINGRAGRQLGQPGEALSVRIGRDDYETFLARY